MGSLHASPPPPLPPENPASGFRILISVCGRNDAAGTTVPNWLDIYNPADHTWDHIGGIPGIPSGHVLKGFAMVALGDVVYVIGGRLCLKVRAPDADGFADRDVAVRSDVLRYKVATREWSACAPLALPRFDFACVACNGKIYVAGGQFDFSSARGTSAAEVYDPSEGRWAPLPAMTALRYKCVGVAWKGRFHVVGGFAAREGSGCLTVVERSSAEVFDEGREEWELMPGMWQLDVPPNQIVPVDGRLFSSGDCLKDWKGHIEMYDGNLNIWSVIERSQLHDLSRLVGGGAAGDGRAYALQRLYLTMAPIGDHLYFVAGYRVKGDETRSMTVVHAFNTATRAGEAWESFEPLTEDGVKEMCSHCCVVQLS
ncbi:hypothetical protein Cni_G24811 [Canna indica]|uniref:Uncharacterized protein n=1 Tax=Canna indica TaxID=4628 RepID=A0AAQ3KWF9_9LILI|nr:hypothetical protein Cni_G24811 [Canna indica]